MTSYFCIIQDDFNIYVECDNEDMVDAMKFEYTRIESLKERDIKVISGYRVWDKKRKITVVK